MTHPTEITNAQTLDTNSVRVRLNSPSDSPGNSFRYRKPSMGNSFRDRKPIPWANRKPNARYS